MSDPGSGAGAGGPGNVRRFLYDGDALALEYGPTGTLLARHVHGVGAGDDPLVTYPSASTSYLDAEYLYTDRLGSVIARYRRDGSATAINGYDEYGVPGPSTGVNNNGRFRYTGQVWLPELGLYYYKARMYSPTIGRFMQTDPIGYADGMNMYAYVGNDPVNAVDPTGLSKSFRRGDYECYNIKVTVDPHLDGSATGIKCFYDPIGRDFAGALTGRGRGLGEWPERPERPQSDKPNVLERAGQCALDHYGLNLALGGSGGALAAAGANVIETRGKFAGATPGTSWAGRAASAIYGDAKMAFKLPTLTGFPGIGNGLKLSSTLSAAKFAGRAVPVLGYALLAADALAIGICTVNSGE